MPTNNVKKKNNHFPKLQSNRYFLILIILLLFGASSCSAQKSVLMSISSAERSDGQGYVVRFHMLSSINSYKLVQPAPNVIQLAIYDPHIDTADIKKVLAPIFEDISLYQLENGIGAVINIKGDTFYRAQAYPDGSSKDLLLALTKTSKNILQTKVQPDEALTWAPPVETPDSSTTPVEMTRPDYNKLKQKLELDVIVLDAGHGGHDPGTHSYRGVYEKEIVLSIAKKVGHYIEKNMPDVKVVYTRDEDFFVGLKERGRIANQANGDLFVSIHANAAASSRARGTEVYFLGLERSQTALEVMQRENNVVDLNNKESESKISQQEMFIYELANSANITASQQLAGMIRHQFKERANRHSRGVKQARFVVLYHASMPAVLVEVGFITNPDEGKYLTSDYGQSIIASAIYRAIRNYKQQFAETQGYNND